MQTALTTASPTQTIQFTGDYGFLWAYGTWGSGTLTLTWCDTQSGTFVPIGTGVSLTTTGSQSFLIPNGFITATLSGSTGATVQWNIEARTLWT